MGLASQGDDLREAWVQLIRDVIASWRLLLGAAVLVLVCTPAVVALAGCSSSAIDVATRGTGR